MNEEKISAFKVLRMLAKKNYYQSLFSLAKEIKLGLFENDRDLSTMQMTFLHLLSMYSSINLDVAIGDVNKIVLEDETYEDAYMYYKNNKKVKDKENKKQESQKPTTQWVFKSGAKNTNV